MGLGIGESVVASLIISAISVGAQMAINAGRKTDKPKILADRQPTLTTKGSILPMVFGRRRIAPVFAYVGDRKVEQKNADGGSSLGGPDVPGPIKYYEAGLHVLAVGPLRGIRRIISQGKVIFNGYLLREFVASGSTFQADHGQGTFQVYWGEKDQPANVFLSDPKRLNVYSRWPGMAYILWTKKLLGTTPAWPNIEYDVDYDLPTSQLDGSNSWIEQTVVDAYDDGVNGAHLLWQLLTGPSPYGLGIPVDHLDGPAFEAMGRRLADEHIASSVLIDGGTSLEEIIGRLQSDLGFLLPQKGGKISPMLIRPPCDNPPVITEDMLDGKMPEHARMHELQADKWAFRITSDYNNNSQPSPIPFDNDGIARLWSRTNLQSTDLTTIGDTKTGLAVAMRKALELAAQAKTASFSASRAARYLSPGDPFIFGDVGLYRVTGWLPAIDSPLVKIDAIKDQYSHEAELYTPPADPTIETIDYSVAPDLAVRVFQVPAEFATPAGEIQIMVWRVRAHAQIIAADVYISTDGVTYSKVGSQDLPVAGGTLNSFLLAVDPDPMDTGPSITPYNDDVTLVLALDDTQWADGLTLMLIEYELTYLKNVTAESGGYELDGIIRAQQSTIAVDHAAGAQVLIAVRANLVAQRSKQFISGRTIYVKTQPRTLDASLDLADATPVLIVLS